MHNIRSSLLPRCLERHRVLSLCRQYDMEQTVDACSHRLSQLPMSDFVSPRAPVCGHRTAGHRDVCVRVCVVHLSTSGRHLAAHETAELHQNSGCDVSQSMDRRTCRCLMASAHVMSFRAPTAVVRTSSGPVAAQRVSMKIDDYVSGRFSRSVRLQGVQLLLESEMSTGPPGLTSKFLSKLRERGGPYQIV